MGASTALSPVPSAGRTVLHGTSQLLLEGWFSFMRNLESACSDLSLSLYPEPLAQEKAWVTYHFSSANLLLLCPSLPPLKFYKLMTVCMCSADGQKTWEEFLDFSPPVCLVWLTCWELDWHPLPLRLQGGPVGRVYHHLNIRHRGVGGGWCSCDWLELWGWGGG